WGDVASPADLLQLVTRASYGSTQLVATAEVSGGSPLDRIAALLASFTPFEGLLLALVDANPGRPIVVVGNVLDDSLKGSYWYYYRGFVAQLLPMAQDVKLGEMAAENERLLGLYRPPDSTTIKTRSFEPGILVQYASVPQRVGSEYEKGGLSAEARRWYQRAL